MTVIELRQYTLHPGRRDELIALFDAEFISSQQDCGISVLGQFRDLDRPNQFVWLRSFPSMEARRTSLAAFYDGPVWAEHGPAANATMVDSDDVLLLRPVTPIALPDWAMRWGEQEPITITVHQHDHEPTPRSDDLLLLVTDPSPNTFPRLPVREGEDVDVRVRRGQPLEEDVAALQVIRAAPTSTSRMG